MTSRLDVPRHLHRSLTKDDRRAQLSALHSLDALARRLGRPDLAGVRMLDVGCGVKFTQVILNEGLPIGRYAGVDVYEPLITFLRVSVTDDRFTFHHLDFHNERYNPAGHKMTPASELPLAGETFDVMTAYSVFTHLNPGDAHSMLSMLRRYASPGTVLCFTAFLDAHTEGGHGLIDQWSARLGGSIAGRTDGYRDFTPDDPLRQALYTEEYLRQIARDCGWDVQRIEDPTPYEQHMFIVRPA